MNSVPSFFILASIFHQPHFYAAFEIQTNIYSTVHLHARLSTPGP